MLNFLVIILNLLAFAFYVFLSAKFVWVVLPLFLSVLNIEAAFKGKKKLRHKIKFIKTRIALNFLMCMFFAIALLSDRTDFYYIAFFFIAIYFLTIFMLSLIYSSSKLEVETPQEESKETSEVQYSNILQEPLPIELDQYRKSIAEVMIRDFYFTDQGGIALSLADTAVLSFTHSDPGESNRLEKCWQRLYSRKYSAEDVSQTIYRYILEMFEGQPDKMFDSSRMPEEFKIKELPPKHNYYLFGRLFPSKGEKIVNALTWLVVIGLLLAVFNISEGTRFIPADVSILYGQVIAAILVMAHIIYLCKRPLYTKLVGGYLRQIRLPVYVLGIPLIYFCILGAFSIGYAYMYTKYFGSKSYHVFVVQKENEKPMSSKAFCLENESFKVIPLVNKGYCLDKKHYDYFPSEKVPFVLKGRESELGLSVDGHYLPKYNGKSQIEFDQFMEVLTVSYLAGKLSTFDLVKVKPYLEGLLEAKNSYAQYLIAKSYEEGWGETEADMNLTEKWMLMAASKGNKYAALDLSAMYILGEKLDQDFIEGYAWSFAAKVWGLEEGERNLKVIENKLSKDDLKKAKLRAARYVGEGFLNIVD